MGSKPVDPIKLDALIAEARRTDIELLRANNAVVVAQAASRQAFEQVGKARTAINEYMHELIGVIEPNAEVGQP